MIFATPPQPDPPPEASVPATIVPTFIMELNGVRYRCLWADETHITCFHRLAPRRPRPVETWRRLVGKF